MELILFHRIADAECAEVRRTIVERGLKSRIDFQNVLTDAAARWAELGGQRVPALWDGERVHEGRDAVLAELERMA